MHALNPQDENSNVDTKLLRITITCLHLCLKKLFFLSMLNLKAARWRNGSASDSRSEGWVFKSLTNGKMDGTSATATTTSVLF
ncbi:hypothetical protein T08_12977 [Trichinella sp. T8]|uniref:Uncharacterized protein n=1 Tax=Trichinella murrelli TaxID=144512 RepID=A0A0V0TX75_9BILA|nr:hypothetical protein T05_1568 [Trichinella murrelli]KRZ95952.1 hypothetical protein T08_12977 [Trichinella sp. T8]